MKGEHSIGTTLRSVAPWAGVLVVLVLTARAMTGWPSLVLAGAALAVAAAGLAGTVYDIRFDNPTAPRVSVLPHRVESASRRPPDYFQSAGWPPRRKTG